MTILQFLQKVQLVLISEQHSVQTVRKKNICCIFRPRQNLSGFLPWREEGFNYHEEFMGCFVEIKTCLETLE